MCRLCTLHFKVFYILLDAKSVNFSLMLCCVLLTKLEFGFGVIVIVSI